MKLAAFITEYNPFHYGHLYNLTRAKEITKATHTIAIMSSSFVQRGEPALVDKWTRAKMAIDNGVDLVIELPFVFASQNAEVFATGACKILDSINCVNALVFGSEAGDIDLLGQISEIISYENEALKKVLKDNLSRGVSYPIALSNAVVSISGNDKHKELLNNPNNILGIEYLKALKKIKSSIIPYTYKREGSSYNDTNLNQNSLSSATAIRKQILKGGIESIRGFIPVINFKILKDFHSEYSCFNSLDNYYSSLIFKLSLLTNKELEEIQDIEVGLENRILNSYSSSTDIDSLIGILNSKRYTSSRIRRVLLNILLSYTKQELNRYNNASIKYVRVLGSNTKGFEIIKAIKTNSTISIINKLSDSYNQLDSTSREIIDKEILATTLYFFGLGVLDRKRDFTISPYILK